MSRGEAVREYVAGSLWVRPGVASLGALGAGALLSRVTVPSDAMLAPMAFQGTADDARTLLIGVTATIVTVIALVLGLTVVALQLSSTQFSPRLLRSFLRDRPNQLMISVFLATFAYTAAGLYSVGVASGRRTEVYPRLAVTGSLVLLFASLGMVVYFADHLSHSIQIDAIMLRVQRNALATIRSAAAAPPAGAVGAQQPPATVRDVVPERAVPVRSRVSGYVQTAHPQALVPAASRAGTCIWLRPRVGEHVVTGTTLAWVWSAEADGPAPDGDRLADAVHAAVRVGFERTLEQDAGLGIRQLVDIACKALSPAVNDPYTAVQAVDHLCVVLAELARVPLGTQVYRDPAGPGVVFLAASRFETYLSVPCGLIRRYGAGEPTVSLALLRMLATCGAALGEDSPRWAVVEREAALTLAHAERTIGQPADLVLVRERAGAVRRTAEALRGDRPEPPAGGADAVGRM
jgi:uncharacterized membrane protein